MAQRRETHAVGTVRRVVSKSARAVALEALRRIERDGAYANLVLGPILTASGLSDMDRRFVTELVYGSTRMRRACDALIDRFVSRPPHDETREAARVGAERHPDAQFVGPLGHEVGQHAVEAGDGQHERDH